MKTHAITWPVFGLMPVVAVLVLFLYYIAFRNRIFKMDSQVTKKTYDATGVYLPEGFYTRGELEQMILMIDDTKRRETGEVDHE